MRQRMKGSRVIDWARIHREWVERYLVTRALELIDEEIKARQTEESRCASAEPS